MTKGVTNRDGILAKCAFCGLNKYVYAHSLDRSGAHAFVWPGDKVKTFASVEAIRREAEAREEPERTEILKIAERIQEIFSRG